MTITIMIVDLQVFRVSSLEWRTCVFITIETNYRLLYRDTQSFTSQKRRWSRARTIYFQKNYQFIHENYHFNLFVAIFRGNFEPYVLVLLMDFFDIIDNHAQHSPPFFIDDNHSPIFCPFEINDKGSQNSPCHNFTSYRLYPLFVLEHNF